MNSRSNAPEESAEELAARMKTTLGIKAGSKEEQDINESLAIAQEKTKEVMDSPFMAELMAILPKQPSVDSGESKSIDLQGLMKLIPTIISLIEKFFGNSNSAQIVQENATPLNPVSLPASGAIQAR